MDAQTAEAFVNRDDPIPVVSITSASHDATPIAPSPGPSASPGGSRGKREALKNALPVDKLKERLDGVIGQKQDSPSRIQDRLFTMLMQQIVPPGDLDEDVVEPKDRRSRRYVNRPSFSLPLMSSNFRRFNARIGVAFVFQNRLIRLFSWRMPTQTLSFLAVYTFVCLNPALLAVLPLAACLFFIMVPAFLVRHPPPPPSAAATGSEGAQPLQQGLGGPPIAPARSVRPAPELSKDFFRNMRDLQNSMEDFSRLHDVSIAVLAPLTNFADEAVSSVVFVALTLLAAALFVSAHLLPWRAIFLVAGWTATIAGHPRARDALRAAPADGPARLLTRPQEGVSAALKSLAAADVVLESAPETREVEVFELQRRDLLASDGATAWGRSSDDAATIAFEPFMFSPSPHAPLSPARVAGERPRGTRFFEDVRAPVGWGWADKKWTLDLLSREWVEERCVTGVEVEVEGERWVTDLLYDEERVASAGDGGSPSEKRKGKEREKGREKKGLPQTWEEGNDSGRKGEWRRRRWVRLVKRLAVEAGPGG